jgi:predicted negative regulator of RcsB-dependent stress response
MRSERRHELQHNELADWLFTAGQRIKPYQNMITAAVVALVVGVAAYSWWSHNSAAQATLAWTELASAMQSQNPDDALTRVAESYPNTNVAHVATIVVADFRLAQGCDQRFVNRAVAQKDLGSAVASYEKLLEQCRTPSLLERANYGLARAKEALGDLPEARKRYETVAKWPEGTFAAAATQRLHDLNQRETKLMFDDLTSPQYQPNPAFSTQPELQGPSQDFAMPEESPSETLKAKPETKVDEKKPATKVDDKKPATKVDDKKPVKGDEKKK